MDFSVNSPIQPLVGIFFVLAAVVFAFMAVKDGKDKHGRLTIAARTRFKIALIFGTVGMALLGIYFIK